MGTARKPVASDARKPSSRKARDRRADNSPSRGRTQRLRCPFHAKFPDKVRNHKTSCQNTGFETNARLIEHLKRAHGPMELRTGIAHAKANVLQSPPPTSADDENERVTQEQLDLIASLPRNSNIQEKWDKIYKIIFPGEEDVKPAYMPSAEQLRDYACDPPDWLLTNLRHRGILGSDQEIIMLMRKFLVFLDIVDGSSCSSQPLVRTGSSSTASESLVDHSSVSDMKDMNDNSEGYFEEFVDGIPLKVRVLETLSPPNHDPSIGKR